MSVAFIDGTIFNFVSSTTCLFFSSLSAGCCSGCCSWFVLLCSTVFSVVDSVVVWVSSTVIKSCLKYPVVFPDLTLYQSPSFSNT